MSDTEFTADMADPLGWRPTATGPAVERTSPAEFEDVVEPLMADLLRYFVRRVTPREDAADLLSDTLLVLWQRRTRLPAAPGEQRAWAYGVARKVLANHTRKQARRAGLASTHLLRASLAASAPPVSPAAEDALEALASLPERDQELIRLIVWDGFGVGEAGAILGMKEATTRSRFARAKARLREQLGRSEPADRARSS